MSKYFLDTTSVDSIYISLSKIMNTDDNKLRRFLKENFNNYVYKQPNDLDLNSFYNEFKIDKNNFYFEFITINHVTTRLIEDNNLQEFKIDNLEKVLLSENTLTKFFKENQIEFLKNKGIEIYYKNKLVTFSSNYKSYLITRLERLGDSCVNGFLFSDEMPACYRHLAAMPEIVSNILAELDRRDLQKKYLENNKCFVATIKINIDDIILVDSALENSKIRKSEIVLRNVICYLCLKHYKKTLCNFENPIIRLPDNKNIDSDSLVYLKEISNYEEIFNY